MACLLRFPNPNQLRYLKYRKRNPVTKTERRENAHENEGILCVKRGVKHYLIGPGHAYAIMNACWGGMHWLAMAGGGVGCMDAWHSVGWV